MAGFYGGDTEQMRGHGTACKQGAESILEVTERARALIDAVAWVGPDADAFRDLWHGSVEPGLRSASDEVRGHGDELDKNADEQDEASGSGDGGGILDRLRDLLDDMPPIVGPVPGSPLTPDVIRDVADGLDDWFTGGGATGDQSMFGAEDDFGEGQVAADGRPIGQHDAGGSYWEGREIENDAGYVDVRAEARASAGAHVTQDEFGNYTASAGARAGAEVGLDEALYGPDGEPLLSAGGRVGAEAYAEAGVSGGPDGVSGGARAGIGAYGDLSVTAHGPFGASNELGVEGYAGAHAEANAYANLTRNENGQINGAEWGAGASAFAGAEGAATFEQTSPGGWFFAEGSAGAQAGAGIGGDTGGAFSTDEISFGIGGEVALGGGVTGDLTVAIHPNEIVDTFTPGDYNIDDALSDASGAARDAGNWVADNWPF
ncbi:hypothetical protein [Brachybacterium sp.]|uniref:WXG100 family type VII secretion target n=1 Tax=Brachybacterium sp. TaxID=1891286 RepID=UPI002ED5EF84